MKKLFPLHGIVTVLNTPFTQNDEVDYKALVWNVEEALLAGVAGFLVPAMASEVHKLTLDERLTMVESVLQTVNGKVPVFAGTGGADIDESIKILKSYLDLGCRHVLVQLPYYTDRKFKKNFLRLAALDPEVIMLQDWDPTGYGLNDGLLIDLFETVPSFRCLKIETAPAGPKYSRMMKHTRGKLNVSGGWAVTQMIEGLKRGVHAFMPTGMHWIYTKIFNYFQEGEVQKAEALFSEIIPVLAFSNQHLDISIHFYKMLLWKQGIYPTPNVREPIIPFDEYHQEMADLLIPKVMEIEDRIKKGLKKW